MGWRKNLWVSWCKCLDVMEPAKRYTQFGLDLKTFPVPGRGPVPDPLPSVALLTPCKNSAADLPHYVKLIDALDYPKDRLHLRVLEGDSTDNTVGLIDTFLPKLGLASAERLTLPLGVDGGPGRRSRPDFQRQRRSALAKCRNALLRAALETDAEVFVFIDVDMAEIPPETLREALRFPVPVLMANCLLQGTEAVFDLNSFRYTRAVTDQMARRFVKGGIYQPPKGYFRHYTDRSPGHLLEPLHSVGGTFLMLRREVAEAGVVFPEDPYHIHIETEGFALMAAEAGFGSFCAPQLVVYHPWER